MSKLAINGGKPLRGAKAKPWPRWPIWDEKEWEVDENAETSPDLYMKPLFMFHNNEPVLISNPERIKLDCLIEFSEIHTEMFRKYNLPVLGQVVRDEYDYINDKIVYSAIKKAYEPFTKKSLLKN